MGLAPQVLLDAHFADEGAVVGIDLHEDDAAEAVMGAHHITAMDEVGVADYPVAVQAQGLCDAHAVHKGAALDA